jgi:hypothetical protein
MTGTEVERAASEPVDSSAASALQVQELPSETRSMSNSAAVSNTTLPEDIKSVTNSSDTPAAKPALADQTNYLPIRQILSVRPDLPARVD